MSTLRMADGAFPIATRLTVHPVGLLNLDQSPGSPTPISARLSLPPAASALFRSNGKDAAIMLEASPSFIRSRRVGAGKLSMLSSLGRCTLEPCGAFPPRLTTPRWPALRIRHHRGLFVTISTRDLLFKNAECPPYPCRSGSGWKMKTAKSPAWTNGRLEMPWRSRHDVRMLAREV